MRSSLPRFSLPLLLLASALLAHATIASEINFWNALSQRHRDLLTSGETIILEEEISGNPWPRFIVYHLVKATPSEVAAVFWDLKLDPQYIPNCATVTILSTPSPSVVEGEYTIRMPFLLPDEIYVSRNMLRHPGSDDLEISWEVLRSRYIKSGKGALTLQAHEGGTLLRYSNLVEPGSRIAGLMRKNAGHQLVESVKALVAQVTREKTNSPAVLEKQLKTLQEALQQPSTQ
jgi:hypothetical protein